MTEEEARQLAPVFAWFEQVQRYLLLKRLTDRDKHISVNDIRCEFQASIKALTPDLLDSSEAATLFDEGRALYAKLGQSQMPA